MEANNPFSTSISEPFVRSSGPLSQLRNRLCKTGSVVILICQQGEAEVIIDLQKYTVTNNTVLFLLPDSIISLHRCSKDFSVTYFTCSAEMFRESSFRFNPQFFQFIKEHPCKTLPSENTKSIKELMNATTAIYNDRQNCFRYQIAKNLLQIFLMDLYDKTYRWFSLQRNEGHSRHYELFRKFMTLIHTHCSTKREVRFYADSLCISTKYLTDICRQIIGKSAKKIIDSFIILEIKVLLQNTELPIQAICDQLNFPDQSYLGRYFKRYEKISPANYRSKLRKNLNT